MAVTAYERQLPNLKGMTEVDLGEVRDSSRHLATLVSALSNHFQVFSVNTYVIFVPEVDVFSYKWTIEKQDADSNWIEVCDPLETVHGLMRWRPVTVGLYRIVVKLYDESLSLIDDVDLIQTVEEKDEEFEKLRFKIPEKITFVGEQDIARRVIYDFGNIGRYLESAAGRTTQQISQRYLASLVYTVQIVWSSPALEPLGGDENITDWKDGSPRVLDATTTFEYSFIEDKRIGPCRLLPLQVAVALGLLPKPTVARSKRARIDAERTLSENFGNLPASTKLDLFNLLRFPKSSILLLARVLQLYLEALSSGTASANDGSDLLSDRRNKELLATFFLYGGPWLTPRSEKTGKYRVHQFGKRVRDNFSLVVFDVFLQPTDSLIESWRSEWKEWGETLQAPSTGETIRTRPLHKHYANGFTQYVFLRANYVKQLERETSQYVDVPMKWLADNIRDVPLRFLPRKYAVHGIAVHDVLVPRLKAAESLIAERLGDDFRVEEIAGFVPRMIGRRRFDRWRLSLHARGRAVDFDWSTNPQIWPKTMTWIEELLLGPFGVGWQSASLQDLENANREFATLQWVFLEDYQSEGSSLGEALGALERQYPGFRKLIESGGFLSMPSKLIKSMTDAKFEWGGDWPTQKDFMHFQYKKNE